MQKQQPQLLHFRQQWQQNWTKEEQSLVRQPTRGGQPPLFNLNILVGHLPSIFRTTKANQARMPINHANSYPLNIRSLPVLGKNAIYGQSRTAWHTHNIACSLKHRSPDNYEAATIHEYALHLYASFIIILCMYCYVISWGRTRTVCTRRRKTKQKSNSQSIWATFVKQMALGQ